MWHESFNARIGVVLGSGLGSALDSFPLQHTVAYTDVPGIPAPSVPGHGGAFHLVEISGTPVLVASGRVHLYEGHDARAVTSIVRAMHDAGIEEILLTNAAGSIRADWPVGTFMRIADHLNLTGTSPLEGRPHFLDMTQAYDVLGNTRMAAAAEQLGLYAPAGVYAGLRGPQYETPAEIRMLRTLGADAVGMSTVLETLQARALGMRVTGLSLLTNPAAGTGDGLLDHAEVVSAGRAAAADFGRLLAAWIAAR